MQILIWNSAFGALCTKHIQERLAFSPGTFSTITLRACYPQNDIRRIVVKGKESNSTFLWPETIPEDVVEYLLLHVDQWAGEYQSGNQVILSVTEPEVSACRTILAKHKPLTEILNKRVLSMILRGNDDVVGQVREWLPIIPHPLYYSVAPERNYFSYWSYAQAHKKIKAMNLCMHEKIKAMKDKKGKC